MSTLFGAIRSAITGDAGVRGDVGDRVRPEVMDRPEFPYVVVSESSTSAHEQSSGESFDDVVVDVLVWGDRRDRTDLLGRRVDGVMLRYGSITVEDSPVDVLSASPPRTTKESGISPQGGDVFVCRASYALSIVRKVGWPPK